MEHLTRQQASEHCAPKMAEMMEQLTGKEFGLVLIALDTDGGISVIANLPKEALVVALRAATAHIKGNEGKPVTRPS